ncbi:MAG: bifunctional DNA primase/polymerase [Candidatus Cloacimonetes bacterium]|nr:bifunctional DNA primase/polymerase [Candidatus Cloacimonadota bacterium]
MVEFSEGVLSARKYFADNGIDTLPISVGSKICHVKNWQYVSSDEAWLHAPSDSNIGIRCGGKKHFAVIDCDEKNQVGTFDNIINYLIGLGFDERMFPITQTASVIGRQIYCSLTEFIPGSYYSLSSQFGCGEFRFGNGAYVVAPPSKVYNASDYKWLQGDISYLPEIGFSTISDILQISTSKTRNDDSQNNSKNLNLTRNQKSMVNGIGIDKYKTRSEYEYALMVSLINTGWN